MKTIGSQTWKWCAGLGLAAVLWGQPQQAVADLSEGFETGMPTSYATGDYSLGSGTWSFVNVIRGTTRYAGSYSCQIRSSTGAQAQTPTLAGGVGTISFWVYCTTTTGSLQVNLSTDGGANWTPAPGSPFTSLGTAWAQKQITVDSASVNKVQFYRTAGTLSLDEVAITSYSGGPAAPSVATVAASAIDTTSATANGDVTDDGGDTVTERGVCYKTSSGVTLTDNPTPAAAGGTGEFSVDLSSLDVNQIYYFRAYAENSVDTTLAANELNFTTLANVPAAPTVDNPTATTLDVAVNANGNPAATEFAIQRTSDDNYLQADGTFGASEDWQTAAEWDTTTATGLSPETEYSFQVKARNGANVETAFGTAASESTTAAATGIWINPLSAGTPMGSYFLGDTLGEWFVNFEIGQESWNYAQVGIGTSAEGTGYGWGEASWYEDGDWPNKRVRRNLSGVQFTSVANHYVICQARAAAEDDYTSKSANGWGNSTLYPPEDLASAYFAVSAINDAADPDAEPNDADPTGALDLSWSKNAQSHDVMIVRKAAAASWTEPTQGSSYSVSDPLGDGTVVYVGSGTETTDSGLSADSTYDYKFYSVNNDYYAAGVTAQGATLPCEPDAPTGLHAGETNETDFTATWDATARATGYRLDVSESETFSSAGDTPEAVFAESMGTVGTTTTIANHEAADGFDNDAYTMSAGGAANPADVRATSASSGYTGASGVANIWFPSTAGEYGFGIAGIDASGYGSLSLSFGYRKESASANATFELAYSTDGSTWTPVTVTGLPAEGAATGWYLISGIELPPAAASATLSLRWVKSGSVAMRLDDVTLEGTPSTPSFVAGYENLAVAGTSQLVEGLDDNTTYYFRVRAEGEGGCPSENSETASVTTLESIGGPQTIDFPAIADKVTTDVVELSATASSGLDVSFAVLSGPAELDVDGVTLTFTGAGEVSVVASQAGGGGWDPADPVTNTFDVTKAIATVTLSDLAQAYDGTPRAASVATDPEGLTVDVTYDGEATVPTDPGQYEVVATVVDDLYQGSDTETLTVSVASPVSFSGLSAGMDAVELSFAPNAAGNDVVIVVNSTGIFEAPAGAPVVGEALAGGTVLYVGTESPQTHDNLDACTPYYYKAWSYVDGFYSSGLAGSANTDGPDAPTGLSAVPDYTSFVASWDAVSGATGYRLDVSTEADFQTSGNGGLIISEVADPLDAANAKFVELYNASGSAIDFGTSTWYVWRQANGGSWGNVQLAGTIPAGGTFVVAYSLTTYESTFGKAADQYSGIISGNGDDGYFLVQGGDAVTMGTIVDAYGVIDQDGTGYAWEYLDKNAVRNADVADPNATWTVSEWTIPAGTVNAADMTPGTHVCTGDTAPSFVSGYDNYAVAGTAQLVEGLEEGTVYYFRVRAESDNCASGDSATASTTTLEHLRPVLSQATVNVREGGEGRFFVRLNQDPGGIVQVDVSHSAGNASIAIPGATTSLTFKSSDWSIWQVVTLTAPEDANADSESATFTLALAGADDVTVDAATLDDEIGDNLALASAGATISGVRGYRAAQAIDGVHAASTNYAFTTFTSVPPGTLTLDLQATTTVARVRLLTWDWNYRSHSYTIESSLDGASWSTLVDASAGDHRGWEDWNAGGAQLRYLRLTGLTNSVNAGFCLPEWEVYGTRLNPVALEFSAANVNVREAGEGRLFVRLTSAPEGNVLVNAELDAGDADVALSGPATLTFKPSDWSTWQALTVTAGADADAVNETATLRITTVGVADEMVDVTVLDDDVGENLALASGGATVAGVRGYRTADLIDGVHAVSTNYAFTTFTSVPPGTLTVDLQTAMTVSRVRILTWDWNYRDHRYTIEWSADGASWTTLADASAGAHRGWEDWPVADESIRYLRFTGLTNSVNAGVCVPELEVYGTRPLPELIQLSKTAVNVREGGEGRFFVRLASQPAANVVVSVARTAGDESLVVAGGASLTFKPSNWSIWQKVTLTQVDDANADAETATLEVSMPGVLPRTMSVAALDDDIGDNLALASAGTTMTGRKAYYMGYVIDGAHTVGTQYGYTIWTNDPPGTMTLDLQAATTVSRVRVLNWDWTCRFHRYVVEGSADGETWTALADASGSDRQGWDDWAVADETVRYVRFTGLTNTFNTAVCISELEVIGTRAAGRRSLRATAGGESEPVAVLTSDGPEDESGWNALDGDEATAWVGQKLGGGYLVVEYQPTLALAGLEVDVTEAALAAAQVLTSLDAQDWQPLPEDLEANPVSLNFLWIVFPDDGTDAVPEVIEIRPNP
jgi:hypothetical protein